MRRVFLQIEDSDLLDRVATILTAESDISLVDNEDDAEVSIADGSTSSSIHGGAPRILLAEAQPTSDPPIGAAVSVMPRDCTGSDLVLAIEATVRGYAIMPLAVPADTTVNGVPGPSRPRPGDLLTAREREVLRLLAEGASNKEIARRLGISFHTAKFHVASVAAKLDATGRTDAVAQAVRLGLIML